MLDAKWEAVAARFVNATDGTRALATLGDLLPAWEGAAAVVIARDTRSSSPMLAAILAKGAQDAGASVIHIGIATTPQLHFCVRARYRNEPHDLEAYYAATRAAFIALCGEKSPERAIIIDCADGVGALAMRELQSLLPGATLANTDGSKLNVGCGADFVQKTRNTPRGVDAKSGTLCASLDGDADRIVIYEKAKDGTVTLADGDRFAALLAHEVAHAICAAGINTSLGVAQTAYSNGAATAFLRALPGVQVVIAHTGVKHLERAVHDFDVGVYWEPNGHGTVLYSDKFRDCIDRAATDNSTSKDAIAVLRCIGALSNQAVGDGVADLLLVLGLLTRRSISLANWMALYDERCVANAKVCVRDKAIVRTIDFDRKVAAPDALRERIVRICEHGVRAFVRPSGTEDVVRVFAEADSQDAADRAAVEIARAVYDTCEGVGER